MRRIRIRQWLCVLLTLMTVTLVALPSALADVRKGQRISQFIWRYQTPDAPGDLGPLRACRIVNQQQQCVDAADEVYVFSEASLQGRRVTWSQRITILGDNGDTWDITHVAECRDGNGVWPEGSCGERQKSCADTDSICGWGAAQQWGPLSDNSDYSVRYKTYAKVQCGGCWWNNWLFQIPDPGTGYFRTGVWNCYARQTSPCVF